jgi:exosortase
MVLLVVTAWSYGRIVPSLFHGWQSNDDYSAGQLVPLVALFFVWRDWRTLAKLPFVPCWYGGITLLVVAAAVRTYGLMFVRQSIEQYSLVLAMAGLVLLIAGWQVFRRVVWILLFLFLMFPLPGVVHNAVAGPLQRLATTGSVVLLEAVGASISQQGNVVMLGENTPMAVAEACSGLRMLTAFIIVAAFIAYMVKRPRWQKAVLLASSIPVAVVCNIVRIFATGLLMLHVSSEVGEKFFHDFAGLVMMPAAVLLLFGELWLLDKVVVPETGTREAASGAHEAKEGRPQVVHAKRKLKDVGLSDA